MPHRLQGVVLALCAALCLTLPASSFAADQIFWSNYNLGSVGRADLAGGNGATVGGLTNPYGTAIDAAAGKVYVADYTVNRVASMNLDGSGISTLFDDTGYINGNWGLSFDPLAGRIFWANDLGPNNDKLGSVLAGGSGASLFLSGIAQLVDPVAPVPDPARNKIYWGNYGDGTIGFADLDSGANPGTIALSGPCTSTPVVNPVSVAVDPAGGRLVVSGFGPGAGRASVANLDGSGCQTVFNQVVTGNAGAEGVAIDTDTGKAYLTIGDRIYVHTPGAAGVAPLDISPATTDKATYPAILKAPAGTATLTPSSAQVGAALTCAAQWRIGTPSASMYRSPSSATTYAWTRGGADVAAASAATYTPTGAGTYACRATASNGAGATTTTSPGVTVTAPTPVTPAGAARLTVSVKAATTNVKRSGKVKLTITTKNVGTAAATAVKTCVKPGRAFKLSGRAKACVTRASLAAGASAKRSITLRTGTKKGAFTVSASAEASNAAKVTTTGKRRVSLRVR